jgi:serine/threonine protein kinase
MGRATFTQVSCNRQNGRRYLVHTLIGCSDIKPSNILVNCEPSTQEITEVQLADFGSTMSEETKYAKDGEEVGTAIFRSPEIMLSMRWSTSTDIWSFGATVR